MLAAGALVASLLAVGASPAAAVDKTSKANNPAETSACVGPAMADAGFEDTAGLGAEAAINCLAYYGITVGKTATTFDPGSNVTREQMALFLYRAAGVAGIDLSKGSMAASFGDLGEVGAERQTAIAALARNGILNGRSSMSFVPTADITRAEMAVALINLLTMVPGSGVAKNVAKNDGTYVLTPDVTGDDFDTFADSFASVSAPVDSAVSAAYEMGITTGYGDYTFRPNNPVPRKNMASFITRALAHTNARPAGLTAQVVSTTTDEYKVRVSVRDANFAPIANEEIDAFKIEDKAQASRAFKSDGTCSTAFGAAVDNATKCEIGLDDPVTGSSGNLDLSVTPADATKGTVVWVWTGQLGTKVTASTDLYEVEVPGPGAATGGLPVQGANDITLVSTDFKGAYDADGNALVAYGNDTVGSAGNLRAKYGSTVTFKIQLKKAKDLSVPADDDTTDPGEDVALDARPDADGDSYKVTITYPTGAVDVKTYVMDSNGSASFSLTAADPDPKAKDAADAPTKVEWQIDTVDATPTGNTRSFSANLIRSAGATGESSLAGDVYFTDTGAAMQLVKAEPVNEYWPAAGSDRPTTGNALIATVLDQYGDGLRNACVTAASTGMPTDTSVFPTDARTTASDGKVRIYWRVTATAHDVETVTVTADPDCDTTTTNTDTAEFKVFWTEDASAVDADNDGSPDDDGGALLTADVVNNILVLDEATDEPTVFRYDANDQFLQAANQPITMAAFEAELTKRLSPGGTAGNVSVASYKPGDSGDIAIFTLG